jgi:hypothetical protein
MGHITYTYCTQWVRMEKYVLNARYCTVPIEWTLNYIAWRNRRQKCIIEYIQIEYISNMMVYNISKLNGEKIILEVMQNFEI